MKGETNAAGMNLQYCTEETPEPGEKRLHPRNNAGVRLDCGDVSHRAVRITRLAAKWTCPNCRGEIAWTEQIIDQYKRAPRPGDNVVCVECSAASVVTTENRLRRSTEVELLARRSASQNIIGKAQAGG
jgi:hypothetical protein